ncbi:MAG: helix-turn-helix transcriptional regulator [Bacteroidaceae bacterium]|nr:helix-turn-helix transcriptional regulator [Bacteroidaceae bacterium]
MTLYDVVAKLCEERKMPIRQLERMAGLRDRTIQHWDKSTPSVDKVVAVACVLEVPIDELTFIYGGSERREAKMMQAVASVDGLPLTETEKDIVILGRTLTEEGQKQLAEYARLLAQSEKYSLYTQDTASSAG